jgi:thiosulfate/3-mercaptopyruvate sulfurtransferase
MGHDGVKMLRKPTRGGRTMSRLWLLLLAVLLAMPAAAEEGGPYNYLKPEALKGKLEAKEPLNLLDIQVKEGYCEHHLPGAVATFAYPVQTGEEKIRLDAVVGQLQANAAPIVIVCPRGGGGAKRAYDHLLTRGLARERLFILEKGQEGWPYPEMIETSPR